MYSHTQFGLMTIIALVGALALFAGIAGELGPGTPGTEVMTGTMVFLALMIPLFGWLTVTVDEEAVTARFGIGLIRKKIRIGDIRDATQVRNKWYYGWGIRMGPGGWMYNVSGLDAVDIELKDGGRFRVGTDEPEELARIIKVRCSMFDVEERRS